MHALKNTAAPPGLVPHDRHAAGAAHDAESLTPLEKRCEECGTIRPVIHDEFPARAGPNPTINRTTPNVAFL
ncbi:MAG: hypothetical protein LBG65_02350 [Puniceicoccales bacterium]|nr:hypothetical protein [Puniceicoccales bacterium]